MSVRPFVACLALAALPARDADACSCMTGPPIMITPGPIAPLNAHVRVEIAKAGARGTFRLFVHRGPNVDTTMRVTTKEQLLYAELVPRAPLTPHTRYDIANVDPDKHPPTTVFGSFETGDAADTTPPRITRPGVARARSINSTRVSPGTIVMRSTCSAAEPRIVVDGIAASDPGRAGARLAFAIWRADASGRIDDTLPPAATVLPSPTSLVIGRESICDPHVFALAEKGVVVLGLAAVDEAGNKSATQTIRVDMSAAVP